MPFLKQIEWPTWLLVIAVYSSWVALIATGEQLPQILQFALLLLVMTLFSSLSHELIHGHPTSNQALNDAFGVMPLSLFPYYEYKHSHLVHHIDEHLTEPGVDPESFFVSHQKWQTLSPLKRNLTTFNMSLIGRLLIGPVYTLIGLTKKFIEDVSSRSGFKIVQWASYLIGVIAILFLVNSVGISIWLYCAAAYCSLSVIAIRSFYEHRPDLDPAKRTVAVSSCAFFQLLYLCNNFHTAHHKHPKMPWYKLYAEYKNNEDSYLINNGHFYFTGYRSWIKYLFRPVANPIHPYYSSARSIE